jgi:hypothetical protein
MVVRMTTLAPAFAGLTTVCERETAFAVKDSRAPKPATAALFARFPAVTRAPGQYRRRRAQESPASMRAQRRLTNTPLTGANLGDHMSIQPIHVTPSWIPSTKCRRANTVGEIEGYECDVFETRIRCFGHPPARRSTARPAGNGYQAVWRIQAGDNRPRSLAAPRDLFVHHPTTAAAQPPPAVPQPVTQATTAPHAITTSC